MIITANHRLASFLTQREEARLALGMDTVWETPPICAFSDWLEDTYNQAEIQGDTQDCTLINETQSILYFDQIISQSSYADHLLDRRGTAILAYTAWSLLSQWRITRNDYTPITDDQLAFDQWARDYQALCERNGLIDQSQLIDTLCTLFTNQIIPHPLRITFMGFDEYTPQFEHLMQILKNLGTEIHLDTLTLPHESESRLGLNDTQDEVNTMARWAFHQWQRDPTLRIACIIPKLNTLWDLVSQTFKKTFAKTPMAYNLSAGQPLSSYPIIAHGLQALQLEAGWIPKNTLFDLLSSPFFGEAEDEMLARAQCAKTLAAIGEPFFQADFITRLLQTPETHCPAYAERWSQYFSLTTDSPKRFTQWLMHFMTQLDTLGWPGQRTLNSTEYQTIECFKQTCLSSTPLDAVLGELDRADALSHWQVILRHTLFQPKTETAPVQVLGLLEGAALSFDKLWIMGLDDENWPAPVNPNPFIPLPLQRDRQIPHASATRERHFTQLMMNRFTSNNTHAIFSYPRTELDKNLNPSPLLLTLPEITLSDLDLPPYQSPIEQRLHAETLDRIEDDYGPTLSDPQHLQAGTQLIKQQSACPFQAFAKQRLHAISVESKPSQRFAFIRGHVIHRALEWVWEGLGSQSNLNALSSHALTQRLHAIVQKVLTPYRQQYPYTFSGAYTALETERITQTLHAWLTLERDREPFRVIAREKKCVYQLGDLSLSFKIDRMDQTAEEDVVLLDYKTGRTTLTDWFDDRPTDPQMPLYCLALWDNAYPIKSLAYAQIRMDALQFKGLSENKPWMQGIKPIEKVTSLHWTAQIESWRTHLTHLAQQFSQGYAAVSPKQPPQTCQACDLQPLCRFV